MSIDLATARETFANSTDFSVGLEEEFAILDPDTLDLVGRYEEFRDAAAADDVLGESVVGELIASEIEIRSGRGEDFVAAVASQRECRRRLFALAADRQAALAATGTHPWADYRDQRIIDTPHYRLLDEKLGYVAWRNNTFALHVHVGIRDADRAVAVCDRLRPVLPTILAASANSPFLEGRDTRLATARSQIFTRTFPRCGIPDAFGDWKAFCDYIDLLVRTRSISEFTQVWYSIRPHVDFGTVEVRIADAQTTAAESEALSALIVACVAQAARDHDEGVPAPDSPARIVEENMWRAIRHGLDGSLIDLPAAGPAATLAEIPARAAIEGVLEWTAPARAELGLDPALPDANGTQRQRRRHEAGESLDEVFAAVVGETRATYAPEVLA